jgi:PAS domain S-box-containing protein
MSEFAEEILRDRPCRWVVDGVPSGILIVDLNGSIVLVNTEVERLFGYSRNELLGARVESLIPERYWEGHRAMRESYDGASRPMGAGRELFGRRKDGREFPLEIGLSRVETAQGPMVIASVVDITERRRRQDQALHQKEMLLKEVHHRVKNNLAVVSSLLAMQAGAQNTEQARTCLEESQRRVLSIALVHEHLYDTELPGLINFAHYAEQLVLQIQGAVASPASSIRIVLDLEPVMLEMDKAVPCGLILNELVTNAFVHGFPQATGGTITIVFRADDSGRILLSVSNDGLALPEGFEPGGDHKSLGMRVISVLTKQLDGEMRADGAKGARFELRFPLRAQPGLAA